MDREHCEGCNKFYVTLHTLAEPSKQFTPSCIMSSKFIPISEIEECTKRIIYNLNFRRTFGYSMTFTKGDKQEVINKLKGTCLEHVRHSLKYLSELPDDKLMEILEVQEYNG